MSRLWRRSTHRLAHLVLAVALGAFVYSPLRTDPTAVLAVQVGLFPLLALSGLLLWKGAALRRRFRGR
ncbi:hypothetical protein NDI56_12165 [Haloarcula sp. S1CR25-12]|uniref:Uncharacterized protein n=1 Tax=Haloarcula saliterrae TaxID=2950534 RepID=A0ABU2FEJ9_9EURY|nr:hypothetical protein [Haloarcula sp. S1CR25-12]MDS0260150.1 hypothetical protein [Haloarcula sp. S1CR25-12]